MGTSDKLLFRIFGLKIPNDISMKELDRLLTRSGFILQSKVSAHYNYKHPNLKYILTIDAHDFRKEVKPIYIKKVKEALEELKEKEK
jgi:predicted RNA binding protein YcfA (HicA-like mRNA interferase family)